MTSPTSEHGLGRLYAPDDRDNAHVMRAHLPVTIARPKYKYWQRREPVLNQGNTPTCVGHAGKHWMMTYPISSKSNVGPTAFDLYNRCQQLDEWPGEGYPGTSVRALFKTLQEQGRIGEYIWGQNIDDVLDWLSIKGPVIIGIDWDNNMFYPDSKGEIHAGGGTAGGHALILDGVNFSKNKARGSNSWGNWALQGRFWMDLDLLDDRLFARNGEVVTAAEVKV